MAERERVLALLGELQAADAEKGALLDELQGLDREVRALGATASGLEAFRTGLPAERERRGRELAEGRSELAAARAALVEAEEAVRAARKDGLRDAQLFEVRARDRLSVTERRVAEAGQAVEGLEREANDADAAARELDAKARSLAGELRSRPRIAANAGAEPGPGLPGILEWAGGARAALFVARGQVASERDAVVRQATELGSVALGEPLGSASVEVVTRRLRSELG